MALNKPVLSNAIKSSLDSKLSALLGPEYRSFTVGGVNIPIEILQAIGEAVAEEVIDHFKANGEVLTSTSNAGTGVGTAVDPISGPLPVTTTVTSTGTGTGSAGSAIF